MAMKVLNTTNSFIINAKIRIITKEKKQEPKKEPIKSENVGNGQIRNDVEQLSDGLTKLENLLQSGINSRFYPNFITFKKIKIYRKILFDFY